MRPVVNSIIRVLVASTLTATVLPQTSVKAPQIPAWVQRGQPNAASSELERLVGKWHVELRIYGTMGRSPDLPPLVSQDIVTTRAWTANGYYIEDTTEGTVDGQPYWRKGWLGYSNIDRRYEW